MSLVIIMALILNSIVKKKIQKLKEAENQVRAVRLLIDSLVAQYLLNHLHEIKK